MFRAIILPIFSSTRLCVTACGIMHPRCYRQDAVWQRFCSTYRANIIPRKTLEAFGGFRIGRQVIRRVKYADGLVLLAEEQTVLQGMVDRLIEIGR